MHWHGYTWVGVGAALKEEGERGPGSPDFRASLLPPVRTGDWLAKPATRIAASFDDPARAAGWMIDTFAVLGEALPARTLRWDSRSAEAADALPRGVDVQWGEWLPGGRFVTVGAICCSPNRHLDHPCPVDGEP